MTRRRGTRTEVREDSEAGEPKPNSAGCFSCTFCGRHQREVRKLIVSVHAVICDECLAYCTNSIAKRRRALIAETHSAKPQPGGTGTPAPACSFCTKSVDEVSILFSGPPDQYICEECIGLCNDILAEVLERGR